ncbi:hypothetical protein A7P95_03340 [Eikenella longinqua]|uniref:Uncharacterized protein n=1 Tax=Eikenella longinqua TaxID=1795827 RepID=A0A1A9RZN1_9NEIS|nr:hypothetical protein A7P95_03340 [Eikenella longinqua]
MAGAVFSAEAAGYFHWIFWRDGFSGSLFLQEEGYLKTSAASFCEAKTSTMSFVKTMAEFLRS